MFIFAASSEQEKMNILSVAAQALSFSLTKRATCLFGQFSILSKLIYGARSAAGAMGPIKA
jgi:hypothetical protein